LLARTKNDLPLALPKDQVARSQGIPVAGNGQFYSYEETIRRGREAAAWKNGASN
jgi:hypothetical protein